MSCNIMQFMVILKSRVMIEKGVKKEYRGNGSSILFMLQSSRLLMQNCSAYLTHQGCIHYMFYSRHHGRY